MDKSEIIIYKNPKGKTLIEVKLENETVWLNQKQMAELFDKDTDSISLHLKNIFKSGELDEFSTTEKYSVVQKEGVRNVTRQVKYYNLDAIISVGYRVNSKSGILFRKWSTQLLKEYLIKGYALNQKKLESQNKQLIELKDTVKILSSVVLKKSLSINESVGLLDVISNYSKTFELLNKFDTDNLNTNNLSSDIDYVINYKEVIKAIEKLKFNLIEKKEASELFGREKDKSFEGILGSISQTVFGELAYPTIEEQASQLLYSIIKGHAFSDGNKRIGSFIFVWYLEQNNFHLDKTGNRKITENTLVALALAIAQSIPEQRDLIIKLIINLIKNNI